MHNAFFHQPDDGTYYQIGASRGLINGLILAAFCWGCVGGVVWLAYCLLQHKHVTPWGW